MTTDPELPAGIAVFLDFDGTLVEIAEHPDLVRVADATLGLLPRLQAALDGALAIVTGREIEVIDGLLAPFRYPIAGVHGLTRRNALGLASAHVPEPLFLDGAERALLSFARREPGLLVERKSHALALHYRARPDLEDACIAVMEQIVPHAAGVIIVRGKMVVEARQGGHDKGTAIAEFLAEPPFRGRRPLFAGDDITDEDAFRAVNARGGLTIKIGPGETVAQTRLANSGAFLTWLAELTLSLEKGLPVA